MFIRAHREHHVTCSLMICDLDHFKRVNDTYGHQAGDDVIQALASVLRSGCGPGDLVARYGGEEFVMLCADCDNATATRRAEQSRKALSQIVHPKLGGRAVTASFGVTEVQAGDTAETMLRRADRALLLAKEKGRNMVVQLGVGADSPPSASTPASGRDAKGEASMVIEQSLVTSVPLWMAVEKLRGFVADHGAKIVKVDGDYVQLTVEGGSSLPTRRFSDRPTVFRVDIRLSEEEGVGKDGDAATQSGWSQTRIRVKVAPEKNRERRREEVVHRAKEVIASFRSYLMAHEEESADPSAILSDPR
jgi:diguanylate cyclase (GGDEF)-like protein